MKRISALVRDKAEMVSLHPVRTQQEGDPQQTRKGAFFGHQIFCHLHLGFPGLQNCEM